MKRALLVLLLFGCGEKAEYGIRADLGVSPDSGPPACIDNDNDGYGEGLGCDGPDCDDEDFYANPRAEESCDGVDNNCDGQIDEGLENAGPDCERTQGVCSGRKRSCSGGQWAACRADDYSPDFEPEERTCDGLDNDCDGFTDEDCPCTPGDTQPCGSVIGVCGGGQQTCLQGGFWSGCEGGVEPTVELCDGLDNDCDGETDEDLEPTPCPQTMGVCAGATRGCVGGQWATCGAEEYGGQWTQDEGPDDCDGFDNDCDGQIDEACGCRIGDTQRCGGELGVCRIGEQTCVDGVWSECRGGIVPQREVCDGFDNDCDGQTDEELEAAPCPLTQGVCAGALQPCAGDRGWVACDAIRYSRHNPNYAPDETAEHCDQLDNDCDGLVDEGCECEDGAQQPCGESIGACTTGEQTCVGGRWGECDGQGPVEEVCDGVDNDCDGQIDEGLTGPLCDLQAGACINATQRCVDGAWAPCGPEDFGARYEVNETRCDSVDNDCDGETDEACDCQPADIQRCGEDIGLCSPGLQTCVDGAWSACEGATGPSPEACDGEDNDCDGERDEGLVGPPCPLQIGICAGSTQRCQGINGWPDSCGADEYGVQYAAVEGPDHCDGLDNDCDGQIDEECECQPDGPRPLCGTDIGVCETGRLLCEGGQFVACEGEVPPSPEVCDGLDNDCDGRTDQGLTGPACALTEGICAGATRPCAGESGWGDCAEVDYGPGYVREEGPEHCDGLDNDCDGLSDEGCDPPDVIINEVQYDGPGEDGPTEFIELYGAPGTFLSGVVVEGVNGANGEVYTSINLDGHRIPYNGHFLIVEAGSTPNGGANGTLRDIADLVVQGADLQNGADSVRLMWNGVQIDGLAYGEFDNMANASGEGSPAQDVSNQGLSRDDNHTDTDDNARDFAPSDPSTPGGAPLPRVHIALRWDTDGVDMDLHLLRAGNGWDTEDDLRYDNPAPDWGHGVGDPQLVRDDLDGLGPEFIDFIDPIEGRYLVQVEYFEAFVDPSAVASEATVLVFLDGMLSYESTVTLNQANLYWAAAEIHVSGDNLSVEIRNDLGNQPFVFQ